MRTFQYRTWGGQTKTIQADHVQFAPGHVVFLTGQEFHVPFIVLAESNHNVHNLREVMPDEAVSSERAAEVR